MEPDSIRLPCRVFLGHAELLAQDYHQLQVGDVLVLNQSVQDPLEMSVADQILFYVTPGSQGARKAVHIEQIVKLL